MPSKYFGTYDSNRSRAAANRMAAREDIDRERLKQDALIEISRQQARQSQLRTEEETQKATLPLAFGDVAANLIPDSFPDNPDKTYQSGNPLRVPFHQAPADYRQRMIDAYGPAALPEIAKQHDSTVAKITGKIPGLEGFEPTGATVNTNGETNIQLRPQVEPLNDQQMQIAQAIAEGRVTPASALGRGVPKDRERIMALATELGYDVKRAEAQKAALRDFTSGKSAAQRKGLNQIISHIGGLSELHAALGNTGVEPINAAANWWKSKFDKTNAPLNAYKINAMAVAEELAKLMHGGVPVKSAVEDWMHKFSPNAGPETMRKAIQEALTVMAGASTAMQGLRDAAYQDPRMSPLLTKEARETLRKFEFDPAIIDPIEAQTAPEDTVPRAGQPPSPSAQPAAQKPADKPAAVRQNGVVYYLQPDGTYK